jgi:hypothetical protein
MANPPYKQKMGEPPIFRFPPKSGGAKCNKNHAQIQQVGDLILSDLRNGVSLHFFLRQALVLRFDLQRAPMPATALLPVSDTDSSCDRDLRTPRSNSVLLNALTWCAATTPCFDYAYPRVPS